MALRYGMVGGGPGAFIGAVHRAAAALDGGMTLVAGAFSSNPAKSAQTGGELGLSPDRVYDSYQEMADREAALGPEDRIRFVSIVTPNHLHFPVARTFLDRGFDVICDKPMTTTVAEAEILCGLVAKHAAVFAVTHNYTGYPMVKQARELVRNGTLGTIRKIVVEYPQGWLATLLEAEGQKQAEWRGDPDRAGVSSAMGDIGSHAENLARYISGLRVESLCADISTMVSGRRLEDDANVLLHYEGGARGVLYASQISVGEENNLRIRIYGTDAGLEWHQENPNRLWVKYPDRPMETWTRGSSHLAEIVQHNTRLPPGHPEGFIEAFANIYVNAGRTMTARMHGKEPTDFDLDFPTVQDGAIGVDFIHRTIKSGRAAKWVDAAYSPPTGKD